MSLAVRNWAKFQHYKDRSPPWIKLYTELLDDAAFLGLPDAAKGQLCALFLLAAKRGNVLPEKAATLRVLCGCTGKFYLSELIAGGWLVSVSASDGDSGSASSGDSTKPSTPASPSRASARSRELELERETTPPTPARAAFFAAMPNLQRAGWRGTLAMWEDGAGAPGGKPFTAAQIDAGLAEYLASTAAPDFSPRHVVRFVEQAATRAVSTAGVRPIRGETGYLAAVARGEA